MSEHRAFFRETVERILADTLDQNAIEACAHRRFPTALHTALAENGIPLVLVPEAAGGVGGDVGDALAVMRAAGAAAAPGPILEGIVANALLACAGAPLALGPVALTFAETVEGPFHDVPWGGQADQMMLVTPNGDGTRIAIGPVQGWTVAEGTDTADEPRDTLSGGGFASTHALDMRFADALGLAAILRAGQILGAIEWTLTRAIDYAGERAQFGRPIAKFQAVQQMLAELADHALASAGITEAAAQGMNQTLIAAARSRLGDAADAAIAIGHQVHGAIGFSREYALNHRTRRLMAWRDDFGSVPEWRRALAAGLVGCSRESFWPAVSDAGLNGKT